MAREGGHETAGERERRLRKVLNPDGSIAQAGQPGPQAGPAAVENPANHEYNYRTDLGMFGDRRYEYQVGDEFHHPGPEPDRATEPEAWAEWKQHAAAWRNYIGGRQQYVNSMIATGYDPEDLGIFNRKHEGMAGYKRLTMNNNAEINRLRQHGEEYMRGTDAEVDPVTGYYMTGSGPNAAYYDARGMRINAQGQRVGGFYGQGNTQAQYGRNALPQVNLGRGPVAQRPVGGRPMTPQAAPLPTPAPMPQPPPRPTPVIGANTNAGWGGRFAARPRRNRQTSPYGI